MPAQLLPKPKFDSLWAAQEGKCGVCKCELSQLRSQQIHTDHDHSHDACRRGCGECVRGILCGSCNGCVGQYEANRIGPKTLLLVEAIKRYLANPPAHRIVRVESEPRLPDSKPRETTVVARVETWLADQVDELAARMDVSRSWVIRRALLEYIEREAGE